MPRPAKKKTRVLSEASTTGYLIARTKHYSKIFKNKKQTNVWIIQQIEKLIDKIDPLEFAAVLGMTWVVKQILDVKFPDFRSSIQVDGASVPTWGIEGGLRGLRDVLAGTEVGVAMKELISFPNWQEYLVSFVIAFIIVRHGAALLGAFGGMVNLVGALLPVG